MGCYQRILTKQARSPFIIFNGINGGEMRKWKLEAKKMMQKNTIQPPSKVINVINTRTQHHTAAKMKTLTHTDTQKKSHER